MADSIKFRLRGEVFEFPIAEQAGQKAFKTNTSKLFPLMYTTDRPLNAHLPPINEEILDQDFFHAGIGEINFAHGKRIFKGPVDTRISGVAKCPPKLTKATITVPASITLSDELVAKDCETATGWTASGGKIVRLRQDGRRRVAL